MSGAHLLRSYAHLNSPLHRAPASVKMLVVLLVIATVAFVPIRYAGWTLTALALVAVLSRVARVPFRAFAARLALAEPFVLGVAVLALFQPHGLAVFGSIVAKSTTCVALLQLFSHTTPFQDVLAALRRAKLPHAFVATIALLYRYAFVVAEETRRMQRARAARTWRKSTLGPHRALASVIAVSFMRSIARAERIHVAMRARGAL